MPNRLCDICSNLGYVLRANNVYVVAELCPGCTTTCSTCSGEGTVVRTDSRGYEILSPCQCQALAERVRRFNSARIPARYLECDLTNYVEKGGNQKRIFELVFRHVQRFVPGERGLLLAGSVGTGKTHLLVAILREITLRVGMRTRFVEFTHLLAEIKEGFNLGRNEAEVLGPIVRVPVLGIDELGKGLTTDWQLTILDEIISRRYNTGLTTYFTTNIPLKAPERATSTHSSSDLRRAFESVTLQDRVGDRIFSRLYEMCEFVTVTGPDARLEVRQGRAGSV